MVYKEIFHRWKSSNWASTADDGPKLRHLTYSIAVELMYNEHPLLPKAALTVK